MYSAINCRESRILIIDQIGDELDALKKILQKEDFDIITSTSYQVIPEQAGKHQPDIILLNTFHSGTGCCQIIDQIRKNILSRDIPVIFLTSFDHHQEIFEQVNYRDIDFISKPFRKNEVLVRIRHQLSLLEARRTIAKQNEKLQRMMESRDKLYSIIAHDLRSPIGTIKMINEVIGSEKERIADPKIRRLFEMIAETTDEAFALLENLLQWSKNVTNKSKITRLNFDLSHAVKQVILLFENIAQTKNITLTSQIATETMVYADEDMIKTVLRNLISNAVKFTHPDGKISITAEQDDTHTTISVKDNGQGIKKENQGKILQDDTHFTSYGTKNEKGSGFGLLLCRDFVKINKGKIGFESEEGKGTTFFFTLPNQHKSVKD